MEDEERSDGVIDTVTPSYLGRPDAEMDVIGWAIFFGLLVLVIPLLPFIVVLWVVDRLRRGDSDAGSRA